MIIDVIITVIISEGVSGADRRDTVYFPYLRWKDMYVYIYTYTYIYTYIYM